jgi:chitinase
MITKANVPSWKVVVGIASYGRSFEMTTAKCTTPECTFTGPLSGAKPGMCTQTAGYLAEAEIEAIDLRDISTSYTDNSSFSNIVVYNNTQWVAYSYWDNQVQRSNIYQKNHLGGTVEWAIDLAAATNFDSLDDNIYDIDNDSWDPPCDMTLSFASLADLEAVADQYDYYCAEIYALQAISSELAGAYANFTAVNVGYDALFGYYVEYVKGMIPPALATFMNAPYMLDSHVGPGNKHFSCILFYNGANSSAQACPVKAPKLGKQNGYSVYYILNNSTGFYDDLSASGIDPSNVQFSDFAHQYCHNSDNHGGHACLTDATFHGFPLPATPLNVTNPKDTITAAGPNMDKLKAQIEATYCDIIMGQWQGSTLDAVQTLSFPVAMVQQSIEAMKNVKTIGKTQEDDDRKKFILEIVNAVLALLAFVGPAGAGVAGLETLSRVLMIIGDVGNAGVATFNAVEDPYSIPSGLFDMFTGGLAGFGRDAETFGKLASQRRNMPPSTVVSMGKILEDQSSMIDRIVARCA